MTPLRTRNYRLYFSGQLISVPGTWLQTVAQAWLVLQLTSSGSALGITVALQTLPVLLLGPWAGSVADAVDKRRLLMATQATQAGFAVLLGVLTIAGVVELWMVWVLALCLGFARAFDVPTRQAFVSELVDNAALPRAISINSTVAAAARMIGPAAGGGIIAAFGVGSCFIINGATFIGPLFGLMAMNAAALNRPDVRAARTPRAVRAGLTYVQGRRDLLIPLLMMALVGTLAFEFQVTIPLLAHTTFSLGATGFGLLYAAMGGGAVIAGLTLAGRVPPQISTLTITALAFAATLAAAAVAPSAVTAAVCLAFAGAASVVYSSSSNSMLQLRAAPEMRGRVVALYIMAFMGSTAIGGPLVGVIGQLAGARASLWAGVVGCLGAAVLATAFGRQDRRRTRDAEIAAALGEPVVLGPPPQAAVAGPALAPSHSAMSACSNAMPNSSARR